MRSIRRVHQLLILIGVIIKVMRIKNLNNAAFSLLEVLLASVIFVVSVAGIFVTLNAVRGPVSNKENQLASTVFAKQALEALYSQVEESTYYNGCQQTLYADNSCGDFSLSLGVHEVNQATLTAANPNLTFPPALTSSNTGDCTSGPPCLTYTVSCADGIAPTGNPLACSTPSIAYRVDMNINWPQSS
jgi:Tfp pilus assembly protein PilV